MPILLTFRTSTGRDEFDEWYGSLSSITRAKVRATLDDLAALPAAQWDRPRYGHLKGDNWKGFHEIILKVEGHHIRLVGYWGPIQGQFIIVLRHDKNEQGALASKHSKVARDRRAEVQINPARAKVWFDA
jgi:hypothetical protein